jgi:hypothetical protein
MILGKDLQVDRKNRTKLNILMILMHNPHPNLTINSIILKEEDLESTFLILDTTEGKVIIKCMEEECKDLLLDTKTLLRI